jgi:hypothetical protein
MTNIVNIALDESSQVVAHFIDYEDALTYCVRKGFFLIPFNTKNGESAQVPPVGSVYNG